MRTSWTRSFVQFLPFQQILLLCQPVTHVIHATFVNPVNPVNPVTRVAPFTPIATVTIVFPGTPVSPLLRPCDTPVTALLQPCQTRVTPLFHIYNTPVTVIQSCRPLHFFADFYLKSKLYSSTSATYTVYRGSRGLERQFRILIDRFPCSARGLCIRAPTSLQGNNVIALFVAIIKNDNISMPKL